MRIDYKAVLFGNGTMGERHRKFFEYSDVKFLKIFDLEDLDSAGNVRAPLVDEFISSEKIDFAVIASPATTHYEYAKLCLKRGISVFVEKPLATLGAQAQELVDLAIRNNVILFVAQSECFNSVFLNFRKHFMNEIGAAGSSFHLEFRREHKYSARCRDVNVALDLLVHDLSLCLSSCRSRGVFQRNPSRIVFPKVQRSCKKFLKAQGQQFRKHFCTKDRSSKFPNQ